ncbi:hypothetical protein KABACHOK_00770 [Brevundimonas phage vB_BpoS-Kabachok]|uniref:HNH endonuclease n=2 Tax=Marchewkavirus TaxID=3425052 RepID=A0A9E7SJ30_9CAUD|nr:hypothetical protein KABACHOK_00770 [Brevundimonas phage vB_BpoS-Kabachok]USN14610.1 hypothetical protein DOMOVOI_01360 [Brevundimonas phage vB_BpoS-Domovoi]
MTLPTPLLWRRVYHLGMRVWSDKNPRHHRDEYRVFLRENARARDGDVCWFCARPFASGALICTIEHLLGRDHPDGYLPENVVVAHAICNTEAGSRPLEEKWALKRAFTADPDIVRQLVEARLKKRRR